MEKLKNIPTCDLVKELEQREGVEKIIVPVESEHEICVDDAIYNDVRKGPAIILQIID